jgi:hypothetical protein
MMTEAHGGEVERLLLYISDARDRAARTVEAVQRTGGEKHVLEALRDTHRQLDEMHRSLTQRTFYAVRCDELTLSV